MRRRSFSAFTFLAALPLVLVACGAKAPADPRSAPPLVRVAVVETATPASRNFTGTVAARVESDLGFRVPGKIVQRLVDAGQSVKRGQPLLRIDPVDLKLAAHAQEEAVVAAQARAVQTSADEVRHNVLRGTGAISAAAYEQAKAAAEAARAQLSAAKAQADVARNASRYAVLVADADGVVLETLAEPGQVVNAGQPVVRLAHAGQREAVIQLPETLRPAIGSSAVATLFGHNDSGMTARLRQLSATADRQTRTYEARYVLEGKLANAPLGATVTLHLPQGPAATPDGVQVPVGALFDAGKGPGVWLIQGDPATVSWRPVTVQEVGDEHARISARLKQGDRIVALGAHLLSDGKQVRVATSHITAALQKVQP